MTSAGGSEPVDLGSLLATDALLDGLATRLPDPSGDHDTAVLLLRSLLADVEEFRLPEPAGRPVDLRKSRRAGVRTAVALGVASAVLATTGVAAAGGGWAERDEPKRAAPQSSSAPEPERTRAKRQQKAAPERKAPVAPVRPAKRPAVHEAETAPKPEQSAEAPQDKVLRTPEEIRDLVKQNLEDGTWGP